MVEIVKQIPFKCKFGHIIIKFVQSPTPSSIICDECININEKISRGEEIFNYFGDVLGNLKRSGHPISKKFPDGERAYRF